METKRRFSTVKITYLALFTALVAVLQYLGGFIRIGAMFSVSLVLVPIVIGSAIVGKWSGAWLGFVFAIMVFITGDAAAFLTINPLGTIITVIVKGVAAGIASGMIYSVTERINRYFAVILSAIVCPIVNTGVFLVGCNLFFYDAVSEWATLEGVSVGVYMISILVGFNFVFELIFNLFLAPTAVKLIDIGTSKIRK